MTEKNNSILLQISKITHYYESKKPILKDISFDVKKKEIFVIIGPSGTGKTTFLKILDLLEPAKDGQILYQGQNILGMRKKDALNVRRKFGMVFQNTFLFDGTVNENVAYSLEIRKVPEKDIKEKVKRALETVSLSEYGSRHVKTLSGGEAQRVAIARVLAYEPELLLLDEPTANLDPANTVHVENTIRNARDTYGTSIILATHNMHQAKRLGDRIALLLNSQFVEVGDRTQIFDNPQNPTTKAFINGDIVY